MANKTVELMFDGELHECLVVEENSEIVCYRKDRRAVKFPADVDLAAAVAAHNEANSEKPITAETVEAVDQAKAEWFGDGNS